MTLSPVLRLSFGLVALTTCVLVLADLFFGIVPGAEADAAAAASVREHREAVAELATAQIVNQLSSRDHRSIEATLESLRRRIPEIAAAAVRNQSGELVASSGAYRPPTLPSAEAAQADESVTVPIDSAQGHWGQAEFYFQPQTPAASGWTFYREHRIWFIVLLPLVMVTLAYLYLRRALLYLDPMSVVPDRLRTAFDGLTEGIALVDRAGRVVLSNRALREIASVDEKRMNSRLLHEAARLELIEAMPQLPWIKVATSGQVLLGTRVHVGSGAERKICNMNCSPVTDARGTVRGCLVTIADITAIEQSNDQLRAAMAELVLSRERIDAQNRELMQLAMYDGLTSLLNRRAFFKLAGEAMARQARGSGRVAVMMLDVDHFKSFNDKYGHSTGDAVLQRVAACLSNTLRANNLSGRYGGEEFCVLIEDLDQDGVLLVAERIRKTIQDQAGLSAYNGSDLTITVSIGVAISPPLAADLPALIKFADEALYVAKRNGRNRVSLSGRDVEAAPVTATATAPATSAQPSAAS